VKRPNLEHLRRIAERGMNMEIPQARDMAETIDYALGLEGALDLIRRGYPNPQSIAKDALGTQDASSGSRDSSPEATKK